MPPPSSPSLQSGSGHDPALGEELASTGLSGLPLHDVLPHGDEFRPLPSAHGRIVLIRHGQPAIAIRPRTGRAGFHAYVEDYERAGLDPDSAPPPTLPALVGAAKSLFTSDRPRALESAERLLPAAEVTADPLFCEAPLAAPPLPLLRLRVPQWAVIARLFWHAGYHPGIEGPAAARARARRAADILMARAAEAGIAVLVAHGYFNFMTGRVLAGHGFQRSGAHRARFWNAVVYDKP